MRKIIRQPSTGGWSARPSPGRRAMRWTPRAMRSSPHSLTRVRLCALEIQRALAAQQWPEGAPGRVRIGIHTGHAVPTQGAYTGLDVHRAAPIWAAAAGGPGAPGS